MGFAEDCVDLNYRLCTGAGLAGIVWLWWITSRGEGLSGGPVFRAHDKATGETIAEIELPATTTGIPMTYMHEGKQYIVVAVGGRGYPAGLVALALPD